MALIQISNFSFSYPTALTPVFQNVNLDIDTNWRLGLVGRNGRGKTTFLNLLRGTLKGTGHIHAPEAFEYFPAPPQNPQGTALQVARAAIAPFDEWEAEMARLTSAPTPENIQQYGQLEQAYSAADGYIIDESIAAETGRIGLHPSILARPYATLSGGEQVKLLLAAIFLKKHKFLIIDEPTDHLDAEGRTTVSSWLATKKGFILVSHDRAFLDASINHILAINKANIELQNGNYSSWRHNRTLQDSFEKSENQRLESSISRMQAAAAQTSKWSDKVESSKKNSANATYNKGSASLDKGYVGHQAARMMQRSKSIERRQNREIEEKQSLLKNIEEAQPLQLQSLPAAKSRLFTADDISLSFGQRQLFSGLSFHIDKGERIAISGANGSGKTSLMHIVTGALAPTSGTVRRLAGLSISTLPQDTDFLHGSLKEFAAAQNLPEPLLLSLLRKLDFDREAFTQPMQNYSSGQKKKVCLAASLAMPAHLFIWDEPLNYIDIISREQIEAAILHSAPTILFVEHDALFTSTIATRTLHL